MEKETASLRPGQRCSLERSVRRAARFGLTLTAAQLRALEADRRRVLADTGRVEFGEGILPALMDAFRDSPYLDRADWPETLAALQEVFYTYKNEVGDAVPDRAVLAWMRRAFDGRAGGSASYLAGWSLKELVRQEKEMCHGDAD